MIKNESLIQDLLCNRDGEENAAIHVTFHADHVHLGFWFPVLSV